jgi:hypothetical protein
MADASPSQSPFQSSASLSTKLAPSRSNISESRSPPSRNHSLRLANMPSAAAQHRQSFSESLRGLPPSPRAHRQPSLSQLAIQDLIDNPPPRNHPDPAFIGRDWRTVHVSELVDSADLRFIEEDTGIEAATNVRISPLLCLHKNSDIDPL